MVKTYLGAGTNRAAWQQTTGEADHRLRRQGAPDSRSAPEYGRGDARGVGRGDRPLEGRAPHPPRDAARPRLRGTPGDSYALGPAFLTFGEYVRNSVPLYRAAKGEVDELAVESGECVHLITEENGLESILYESFGDRAVGREFFMKNREETDRHLHYSAAGKSILSEFDEDDVDAVIDQHGLPSTPPTASPTSGSSKPNWRRSVNAGTPRTTRRTCSASARSAARFSVPAATYWGLSASRRRRADSRTSGSRRISPRRQGVRQHHRGEPADWGHLHVGFALVKYWWRFHQLSCLLLQTYVRNELPDIARGAINAFDDNNSHILSNTTRVSGQRRVVSRGTSPRGI